ncbi:MAG: thioesterase family protein, partial [Nocardioides sp.]|nr:thioesterase family protein [Nocardioides sp.]
MNGYYALDRAVRPRPTAEPGRFNLELDSAWQASVGVINGGYSTAVCLRSLLEMVEAPDPLVVSTTYLRAAVPGPAEVRIEEVGRTRRNVTAQARLLQEGSEVVRTLATCTDLGDPGPTETQPEAPKLPDPADCIDPYAEPLPADLLAGATMTDRVHVRHPELPGWVRGAPTGCTRAEFWIGFADAR